MHPRCAKILCTQNKFFNSCFLIRLRHGPEINITCIVDILPQVIIDFLPPMEVLQTVVTDFVSPHQSRPRLSASIMAEVC